MSREIRVAKIRAVEAAKVRPLRKALLRPMQDASALVYGGDDDPDTLHAAAFLGDRMVGIASVCLEPFQGQNAYRLRGMGTTEDVRGLGHGRALLDYCIEFVESRGVRTLWCNARMSALGFYEKAGFTTVGPVFELPDIGPHSAMVRRG